MWRIQNSNKNIFFAGKKAEMINWADYEISKILFIIFPIDIIMLKRGFE